MVDDRTAAPSRTPGLVWNWSDALFGALIAVPAAIAVTQDVTRGLALAVGVIPAAVVGVAPRRRRRPVTAHVGAVAGASILIGSLLAQVPVLAVPGIVVLGIGAALLAGRSASGRLVMVLALPLVGVGFSYTDVGESMGLALIMAGGSVYATAVSLAWPERPGPRSAPAPADAPGAMLDYGVRLGVAAGIAAGVGFALDLDHVGWACAATLLVMRPAAEMVQLRSVGRLVSVALGAGLAGLDATLGFRPAAYAVLAVAVVSVCSATHRSRWYVTSAFTTFLALSLIVQADPSSAGSRWLERVAETALGVGLAYVFGVLLDRGRRGEVSRRAT